MRPIINSTFVTLDGVVNYMDQWHFDFVDDETEAFALEQLTASDALLMGRNTYQMYAEAWPQRSGEYADLINGIQKYVVSRTLDHAEWNNTSVLSGDLVETATELRDSDGGAILMHGFGPVAKTLLGSGLVDELHLWYHPALAGVGDESDRLHTPGLSVGLRLIGSKVFTSGLVVLSYGAIR
jgi:dihydrofolate reductase